MEDKKKGKFVRCSLCKKVGFKINECLLWCENENINHDDMTIIFLEKVENYPDINYPDIKKIIISLCPDCFEKKLIPWLKSQGAKIGD